VLIRQHLLLRDREDVASVLRAFHANLWVSSILLAGVLIDVVL
jgi:4-hydroxybenzoate polyprenyltransferase